MTTDLNPRGKNISQRRKGAKETIAMLRPFLNPAIIATLLAITSLTANAAEDRKQLPEGAGLAAKYPGGTGLAKDPHVIFVEDFEASTLDEVTRQWESVSHPEIMSLSPDVPAKSGGKQSLLMTHVGGQGEGGHLYRRLPPGDDHWFVRFYVKFDRQCAPIHHFFHVGGYNPSTPYPQGGAGSRPRGDERLSVGIEPYGNSWQWDYYAYWMEMRGSPPRGQTWGNSFIRDAKLKADRDQWICMEAMIRLNDVGESNGELALWIDGRLVSHLGKGFPMGNWIFDKFTPGEGGDSVRWSDELRRPEYSQVPEGGKPFEGIRWRNSDQLKLNFLWLLFYMTDIPDGHVSKVWFDDVVIARQYIGPNVSPTNEQQDSKARIGSVHPRARLIDYRNRDVGDVLGLVDQSLKHFEGLIDEAAQAGCDILVFPEDTLGLGHWEAGNAELLKDVLPEAVDRMLKSFGHFAASKDMYLICCNDMLESDGSLRNTAFLIGRDGNEIGRYHKVNMPIHELNKKRGDHFPVFATPDLGNLGMLICYDMVFPEAPRCLALGGADIIFHPTLGGAAIGDEDVSRAAFRTRAVENFVYVVVSQRNSGSMIISPQGKILAEGGSPDSIVIADIDLNGNREGGDAMNQQRDMRARLFRERSPAAFQMLTNPHPPVLDKIPETVSIEDAVRIASGVLTVGSDEFREADQLLRSGKSVEAGEHFRALIEKYPGSWISRRSQERLTKLEGGKE